jgi:ribonuclease HI
MRVFTDGACTNNGRPGAKAGFAVWFPDHLWSYAKRVPDDQPQTNQRAELSAIHLAVQILEEKGIFDEDIVIYTDSDYSINCLTKWLPGWVARGWKTSEGKDVLHQDLIKDTTARLARFKSHRFHHVRAHTGGGDDLSKNNDIVDRAARNTVEENVKIIPPPAEDTLFPGCPLQLMGAPIAQARIVEWMRANLGAIDADIVNKHLLKAFVEACKERDVTITKQTLQKTPMFRAERGHLQVAKVDKVE